MQDVLGELIERTRMHGRVFCQPSARAPWGLRFPAAPQALFHLITAGIAELLVGSSRISLAQGDLVLLARGDGHVLADHVKSARVDLEDWLASGRGGAGPARLGGRSGPETRVLCGVYDYDGLGSQHPVLRLLPAILHVPGPQIRASSDLSAALGLLEREHDAPARGGSVVVAILAACSDPPVTLAPTEPATLEPTLDALAAFGEKGAGSTAGQMAAMYIQGKFADLGLSDIHTESFHFPRWQLMDKSFSVTIDGVTATPGFDVFEGAGAGTVDAPVVDAGTATPGDLQNLDLTGKIALVRRDQSYHRSPQLKNVREAGAVAMLYLSVAPENFRQVGSVRYDWETDDALPAITIGADDGKVITDALAAHKPVTVHIGVSENSL